MSRISSNSTYNVDKERRLHSEDQHHGCLHRTRSKEEIEKRRQSWLIQQEREREHEIRKQKMILEYELKREAMLLSQEHSGRYFRRSKSRSKPQDHKSKSRSSQSFSDPSVMSQRLKLSDEKRPFFKGPMDSKIKGSEFHRIMVDIHRNIPGSSATNIELKRDIIHPEEVTLKRREDEGIKPIFDREKLKLDKLTSDKQEDRRTIKVIDPEAKEKRSHSSESCMTLSSSKYNRTSEGLFPHCHSQHSTILDRKLHRRRKSNDRDEGTSRNERRERDVRRRTNNSTREDYSKCRSSPERSFSEERKRYRSGDDCSSRYDKFNREYRQGKSREGRERKRSSERRDRKMSEGRRVSEVPHFIEPVPVPIYYANFPTRPFMMGPIMPMRGPLVRSRFTTGLRIPFSPQFMHPNMCRARYFPPNPYFSRMF